MVDACKRDEESRCIVFSTDLVLPPGGMPPQRFVSGRGIEVWMCDLFMLPFWKILSLLRKGGGKSFLNVTSMCDIA